MYTDITGIILAGGKSTRMGSNKSFLKIGHETVIEQTVKLIQKEFSRSMLSTNSPEEYSFLNLPTVKDIYPGTGPLAGIHAGLKQSETEKVFVISCDMPLMTSEMIRFLVEYPTVKKITVAKADGFVQQLCGIYSKQCLPSIKQILEHNSASDERNPEQKKRGCRVLKLIEVMGAKIIDMAVEYPLPSNNVFFNLNKPEEYEFILSQFQKKD